MTKNSNIAVVITAAGSSTRMGGGIKKEYIPLNNGTVLSNCAINFIKTISKNYTLSYLVITHPFGGEENAKKAIECDSVLADLLKQNPKIKIIFTPGSNTRQSSVFNALKCLNEQKEKSKYVLIHDGARPFITEEVIKKVADAMIKYGASVPGVTPVDTQKEIDENGFIVRHLKRNMLTAVQTPQGFEFERLFLAHTKAAEDNQEYTDDTEIWGNYVGQVKVVEGDVNNKKITYPGDI